MYDDVNVGDLLERIKELEARMNAKDDAIIKMNSSQQDINQKLNSTQVILSRLGDFINEENRNSLNVRATLRLDIMEDLKKEINIQQNLNTLEVKLLECNKHLLILKRLCSDLDYKYTPHLEKLNNLENQQGSLRQIYGNMQDAFEKNMLEISTLKQQVQDCRVEKKQTDNYFINVQHSLAEKLELNDFKQFYEQIKRDFLAKSEFTGLDSMLELRVSEKIRSLDMVRQIEEIRKEQMESSTKIEELIEQKARKNMTELAQTFAPRDELKLLIDSRCCDTEKRVNEKIIAQEKVISKNSDAISQSLDVINELNADGKTLQNELKEIQRSILSKVQQFQMETNAKINQRATIEVLSVLDDKINREIQTITSKQQKVSNDLRLLVKTEIQAAVKEVNKSTQDLLIEVKQRISDFTKRYDSAIQEFEQSATDSKSFIEERYTKVLKFTEESEHEMKEMLSEFQLKFNCIPDRQTFMERQKMIEQIFEQFTQFKDELQLFKNKIIKIYSSQEQSLQNQKESIQTAFTQIDIFQKAILGKAEAIQLEKLETDIKACLNEKVGSLSKQTENTMQGLRNELLKQQKQIQLTLQKLDEDILFKAQKQDIEQIKEYCSKYYLTKQQLNEFQVNYNQQLQNLTQLEISVQDKITEFNEFKSNFLKDMHFSINDNELSTQKQQQTQPKNNTHDNNTMTTDEQQQHQEFWLNYNNNKEPNQDIILNKQDQLLQSNQLVQNNEGGQVSPPLSQNQNQLLKKQSSKQQIFPWIQELKSKQKVQNEIQNILEKKANNNDLIKIFDQKANKKLVAQIMNMLEMLKKQLIYLSVSFNIYIKSSLKSKQDPLYNKSFDKQLLLQQTEKLLSWISSVNCYTIESEKPGSSNKFGSDQQKVQIQKNKNNANLNNNNLIPHKSPAPNSSGDQQQQQIVEDSFLSATKKRQQHFLLIDNDKLEKFTDTVIQQYQSQKKGKTGHNQQPTPVLDTNKTSIMKEYQEDFLLMENYIRNLSPKDSSALSNLKTHNVSLNNRQSVTSDNNYQINVNGQVLQKIQIPAQIQLQQQELQHIIEENTQNNLSQGYNMNIKLNQISNTNYGISPGKSRPNTVNNSPINTNYKNALKEKEQQLSARKNRSQDHEQYKQVITNLHFLEKTQRYNQINSSNNNSVEGNRYINQIEVHQYLPKRIGRNQLNKTMDLKQSITSINNNRKDKAQVALIQQQKMNLISDNSHNNSIMLGPFNQNEELQDKDSCMENYLHKSNLSNIRRKSDQVFLEQTINHATVTEDSNLNKTQN